MAPGRRAGADQHVFGAGPVHGAHAEGGRRLASTRSSPPPRYGMKAGTPWPASPSTAPWPYFAATSACASSPSAAMSPRSRASTSKSPRAKSLTLLGPSGCGKSTFPCVVADLLEPQPRHDRCALDHALSSRARTATSALRPGAASAALAHGTAERPNCRSQVGGGCRPQGAPLAAGTARTGGPGRTASNAWPTRQFGRPAPARIDCARPAASDPKYPAHGRALRRAGRDHARPAQRGNPAGSGQDHRRDDPVRDAQQSARGGLSRPGACSCWPLPTPAACARSCRSSCRKDRTLDIRETPEFVQPHRVSAAPAGNLLI